MCYKRDGGLQGTGEQIVNGQITLLLFFLSPNLVSLLFYFTLDFNWEGWTGVVEFVRFSRRLRVCCFLRTQWERNTLATFAHFSKTSFLPSLPPTCLSTVTNQRGGGFSLCSTFEGSEEGVMAFSECVLCLSALACKLMITPCKLYILYINRYMNIYYIRQNVNEKEHERDLDCGEQSSSLCWSLVLIL